MANNLKKGAQGAPGVGFNLTANGNYDMVNKKLTNVGTPTSSADEATKKYVDDNSSGSPATSRLRVDSKIDMKDTYRILNLKSPSDGDQPARKQYADINFFFRNGSHPMTGNVNMNNNRIENLPTPTAGNQPTTKSYIDSNFINKDGTVRMEAEIHMHNNRIRNIPQPLTANHAATKIYSDTLVNTKLND